MEEMQINRRDEERAKKNDSGQNGSEDHERSVDHLPYCV